MHFESRLNRDHMGSKVKDVVKMVGMGMDKGNKKITSLMIIKTSLVASVVLHIIDTDTQGRSMVLYTFVQGVL